MDAVRADIRMPRAVFPVIFLITGLVAPSGSPITITLSDDEWTVVLDETQLKGGPIAGNDFKRRYITQREDNPRIAIRNIGRHQSWRVDVRRIDTNWPSGIRLRVRRADDGHGPGRIGGGTEWRNVTRIDRRFFRGTGPRARVMVRLHIAGVRAAKLKAGTYSTTVVYTVVETS